MERLFFVQIEDKKRQIQSEKETRYLEYKAVVEAATESLGIMVYIRMWKPQAKSI